MTHPPGYWSQTHINIYSTKWFLGGVYYEGSIEGKGFAVFKPKQFDGQCCILAVLESAKDDQQLWFEHV